jgi:hypothetical protein
MQDDPSEGWVREASPAIDSQAVLQQLDRMLRSRHFRNSRRYPAFLAHIVRHRLDGDLDSLKERILGIEVFKRPHDYDTGADPVVRITAGEVRKRIALYYHDVGTEHELRIELPPGSYIPVFFPPASNGVPREGEAISEFSNAAPVNGTGKASGRGSGEGHSPEDEAPETEWMHGFSKNWVRTTAALATLALTIAGVWLWMWSSSPIESMWRPFFGSPDPVLIVIGSPLGNLAGPPADNANPNLIDSHSHVHLAFTDALALTDITGLLDVHRQAYRVQTSATTSLDDLRKRPVVLITAFGNQWSGRILAPLRFSLLRQQVAADGTTILGSIVDHRHPGAMWNFDFTKPITVNSRDYAIVARLHSDLTEGPVTIVAGLGPGATESAGEFVSTQEYLQQINAISPSSWRKKNLELVLEVPIVDGKAGHGRIVASEFW